MQEIDINAIDLDDLWWQDILQHAWMMYETEPEITGEGDKIARASGKMRHPDFDEPFEYTVEIVTFHDETNKTYFDFQITGNGIAKIVGTFVWTRENDGTNTLLLRHVDSMYALQAMQEFIEAKNKSE